MKSKFNYDDIVCVQPTQAAALRPGERAWVVGIFGTRPLGGYFEKFPVGVVYSIEFDDGESIEVHEDDLRLHGGRQVSHTREGDGSPESG